MGALTRALLATALEALILFGPLAIAVLLLHLFERLLAARLQSRLGWRSVWITGWLGVPLHELSHAAVCVLFGHRVERLDLFSPDERTRQLGSVKHAWNPRSLYQQVGRLFIGIAPLLGGVAVLALLTKLLGPDLPAGPPAADGLVGALREGVRGATDLLAALAGPDAVSRGRTWAYLYLCLCVGAHMSPSTTDLRGTGPGLALLLGLVLVVNIVVELLGQASATGQLLAASAIAPLLGPLLIALVLGLVTLTLVTLLTALLPVRRAAA